MACRCLCGALHAECVCVSRRGGGGGEVGGGALSIPEAVLLSSSLLIHHTITYHHTRQQTTIDFTYRFYTFFLIFYSPYFCCCCFCFKFEWSVLGTCLIAVPLKFSNKQYNGRLINTYYCIKKQCHASLTAVH